MSKRRIAWLTTGLIALGWMLLSLGCVGAALITGLVPGALRLRSGGPVLVAGMGGLSLLLATGWLVAARSGFLGHSSRPWRPQRAWIVLGVLSLVVSILALALPVRWHTSLLFTPIHAGLIILTALLILFLAANAAGPRFAPTVRQWLLTLGFGAFSAFPAIMLELIALLLVVGGIVLLFIIFPGGMAYLNQLQTLAEQLRHLNGEIPQRLIFDALRSPLILSILFVAFGLVAPLTEELVKTAVLPLMTWRERGVSLTRAYLWGLACGAGFAMLEGIGNGGASLGNESWGAWASGIATRIPASAMHMLVSGFIGIGWAYFWRGQRWRLPLFYLLAITFHGFWNTFAVGMIGGTAFAWDDPLSLLTGNGWVPQLIMVISFLGLGLLVLVALIGAPLLPLVLRRADERLLGARPGDVPTVALQSAVPFTEKPTPLLAGLAAEEEPSHSRPVSPSSGAPASDATLSVPSDDCPRVVEADHEPGDAAGPVAL